MSLSISTDDVRAVLIGGTWYECDPLSTKDHRSSFDLDAYEFYWQDGLHQRWVLGGGNEPLVPATGFGFTSGGLQYYGPLTSLQAVRTGTYVRRTASHNTKGEATA